MIRDMRSSPFILMLQVILAFCVLISSACKNDRKAADKTNPETENTLIVVSEQSLDEPMSYTRALLLEKLIRKRPGMNPVFLEAGGKAKVQARQIKDSLRGKPAVIVVFPEETEPLEEALSEALRSGTRVIVIGQELGPELCTTSIFVDEKKIGSVAGRFVVDALKKKCEEAGAAQTTGRVVQLTGLEKYRSTRERSAAFIEALRAEPGIVLVHDAPSNWNAVASKARLEEALRLQKQFDVIFAHSDFIAQAAHQALSGPAATGRENILLLGVDGQFGKGGGVQMITRAEIDATVFNPPLVDLAWKIILKMLDDPAYKPKQRYEIDPFIITSEKAFELANKGVPAPQP